jgi:SAM-dependent methyltransferase
VIRRACPICGRDEPSVALTLSAAEICANNSTYRADALARLGLAGAETFAVAECVCGFVYVPDVPPPDFLQKVYDQAIDADVAGRESQSPRWLGHQLRLAGQLLERSTNPAVRFLDYGCGHGAVVRALRTPLVSVLGYDFSESCLARGKAEGLPMTSSLDDVARDAPFDAILLSDVLEHVPDPRSLLERCYALQESGGALCVSVPDFEAGRWRTIRRHRQAGRPITREVNPWEHLNYFSPSHLVRLIEEAGYAAEIEPAAYFGFQPGSRGLHRIGNTIKSGARMLSFAIHPAARTTTVFARRT